MESLFDKLIKHTETFTELVMKQNIPNENSYIKAKTDLINFMRDLGNKLKTCNINTRMSLLEKYKGEIYKLYDVTLGNQARIMMAKNESQQFRGPFDLLKNQLITTKNISYYFASLPTSIFTEFCKGITYFSNEIEEEVRPIYHRSISCGPKTLESQTKFREKDINSKQIKDMKMSYLKRCLIERLIYDEIYNHVLHQQDLGHMLELQKVKRLYQDTFGFESFVITLRYMKSIYPITLTINTYNYDNLVCTETFRKNIKDFAYKDEVSCERHDVIRKEKYEKIQTFSEESPWIKV